jgi:hypothetical protein
MINFGESDTWRVDSETLNVYKTPRINYEDHEDSDGSAHKTYQSLTDGLIFDCKEYKEQTFHCDHLDHWTHNHCELFIEDGKYIIYLVGIVGYH